MDNLKIPVLFESATWQQCLAHYLESLYRRSQSKATIVSYVGILRRFFQDKRDPARVARADILAFLEQPCASHGKQGQPAQVATINARASIISSFYQFASGYTVASENGPVPLFTLANPCAGVQYGQPARVHKSLSIDEIRRFFSVMDPASIFGARDRAIFWTYLLTLRRRSELAGLLWSAISYGQVTDEDGSTRMGYLFTFRGKGRQNFLDTQELPDKAYQEIRHYLELTGRWDHMKPDDPVFASLINQHGPSNVKPGELRALTGKGIAQRLKIYARLAGIPESRFSLHSLRHAGSFLRKVSGEDLFSISRALRHKSLDMTRRYLLELETTSGDKGAALVSARLSQLGVM